MSPFDTSVGDTPRSPEQSIKRPRLVYGKRSNHISSRATVFPTDEGPSSDHCRVLPASAVPSQRLQSSPSPSVHASDSEHSRSPRPFQFGFRDRLKELDEEFDDRDAQPSMSDQPPSDEAVLAGSSCTKVLQRVSMGTGDLSRVARPASGNISPASLPRSPVTLHATFAQEHTPDSPLVHHRIRRVSSTAFSSSEAEDPNHSSSVSPIRHAITTPHSRSSPTPPTSSEISMVGRKTKGKAPARDVLPLLFDGERSLTAELPIKPKKGKRSNPLARPKTKVPTKKERREAALESSRIVADRPVEVTRTQEQRHSLSTFFAGLRRDNIAIPTSGTELPSDPIEKFSSPTDNSGRVPPRNSMFEAPAALLRTSAQVGTNNQPSSENSKTLAPVAGDSDDEMPSVVSIIRQESEKRQRLQAMKKVALRADTSKTIDINEDDDLLIVKDDMHAVAREEAAQRRLDRAHGSPVKDMTTLRRINHPSVRPAIVSPHKLSKQEWRELAKPSFARKGNPPKGQLTKKQLDQLMMMQHTEEQLKSIKQHEEEWVKGGGTLSRDTGGEEPQTSLSQKLGVYAELGLKAVETSTAVKDEASSDDEDYIPDVQSTAKPKFIDADEDSELGDNTEISLPQVDEEIIAPLRRHQSGKWHARIVVGSDDEEQPVHRNLGSAQRDSASSMESHTEDENDKENSAKLMYDRSEDKENKAIARHDRSSAETVVGSRLGSLDGVEDGVQRSVSLAQVAGYNDSTGPPKGDVRSPLKDISKDKDDLFLSSPPRNSSFTNSLLRDAAISPLRPSTSTLSLGSPPVLRSERIGRINRLSLDSENDENEPSGFKPMQPSFMERLHRQVSPEPVLTSIKPLAVGGLSQLFSAEDRGSTKPVDGLSLTLDVGLKPALEVSGTLRQKAETIFEKEQEYVVAAAVKQNEKPKELLYVNDHGFLTQTRPEGSSPQVYRMTPSQATQFIGTQVSTQTPLFSTRPPLRTLSFTISQELSPEPQPLRRLRKRSLSPLEQKPLGRNNNLTAKSDAFSILGKAPKTAPRAQTEKLGKSEFVAVEAEESDEDDMFGFGGPKKEDEEEDDNDQDKIVEGLVDDTVMDGKTEAAELVLEKHREYEEEDDQRLQKLHQDAIEGKFRMKRHGRGVDIENDSDEDEDDDARRIRQRIHKKRKIEGDTLEALGQSEETRAFYNAYHQDLMDEEDEFRPLQRDLTMPVDDDDDDDVLAAEREERETVSVEEVRQRAREMAQSNLEVEVLDPEDTSWIDRLMIAEADDAVRIRVVEHRRNKSTARHPDAYQVDFDVERPTSHAESEQERKQMTSWANKQSHRYQGTGRSGNSTAVTGHTKVKTGGGSLRSTQSSNATSVNELRKMKTPSLLSMVPNRMDRFS